MNNVINKSKPIPIPKTEVKREEAKPKTKTYSLEKQELSNFRIRMELKERYQYLASLIERDMQQYVDVVVKKKLNIPLDANIKTAISFQAGTITVTEGEAK